MGMVFIKIALISIYIATGMIRLDRNNIMITSLVNKKACARKTLKPSKCYSILVTYKRLSHFVLYIINSNFIQLQ